MTIASIVVKSTAAIVIFCTHLARDSYSKIFARFSREAAALMLLLCFLFIYLLLHFLVNW